MSPKHQGHREVTVSERENLITPVQTVRFQILKVTAQQPIEPKPQQREIQAIQQLLTELIPATGLAVAPVGVRQQLSDKQRE